MRRRTGLPWEDLPRELGCGSGMTCWRRLRDWQQYPALASWVKDGWVEIGHTDYTRSFVRAFDEGGMVWEGVARYASLDAALNALDAGIAAWIEENG